jgi:HlyD family secretion protein
MRQIAKWTSLCILCIAFGFGATYLVANSERAVQIFAAMLPASSQPAVGELTTVVDTPALVPAELAVAEDQLVDESAVELAGSLAAAEMPALAPLSSSDSTVGTFAAGNVNVAADVAQTTPASGPLSAVGVIAVVRDRQVVLGASGRVDEIFVEVGNEVSAGDVLIELDTTYLDWAVEQAEIGFETARIDFEEAGATIADADIAVAEANLLLAQENLAVVEVGPTPEELAAAQSAVTAAWANLEELEAQPTQAQLTLVLAQLRRAEIAVQGAQREYDKIAWLPEAAASSAADDLQSATIDYEVAQANYDELNKPAPVSELQSATASAQSAQFSLNQLLLKPTPAELAAAQATLAEAEAALAEVQKGPQQADVRKAELGVREAMIALEGARLALENAVVVAPIDGTVLALDVDLGQSASEGDIVAVLANALDVKLTVNVEQRDIARVIVGQEVQISVYALPDGAFTGVVEQVAPLADAQTGFVTFPVIIRFTDGPMENLLPGMTASATFVSTPEEATGETPEESSAAPASGESTVAPTATATITATAAPTVEATDEPADEPTEEATEEATEEPTVVEATPEATATEESTEQPAAEATATPSN